MRFRHWVLIFGLVTQPICADENSDEAKAVLKIQFLGGVVTREVALPRRPVVGVSLANKKKFSGKYVHILKPLTNLQTLDLTNIEIGDEELNDLTEFRNLTTLKLSGTQVTDHGFKPILTLDRIEELDLSGTQITDVSFIRIE